MMRNNYGTNQHSFQRHKEKIRERTQELETLGLSSGGDSGRKFDLPMANHCTLSLGETQRKERKKPSRSKGKCNVKTKDNAGDRTSGGGNGEANAPLVDNTGSMSGPKVARGLTEIIE
jgi:hypothetical protein